LPALIRFLDLISRHADLLLASLCGTLTLLVIWEIEGSQVAAKRNRAGPVLRQLE